MSQLVRYATLWWTSTPERTSPAPGTGGGTHDEFVNVRFSADEMALIRSVSIDMGLERGAVIRCAVRAWLTAGDFTALGDPSRLTDAQPDVSTAVAV